MEDQLKKLVSVVFDDLLRAHPSLFLRKIKGIGRPKIRVETFGITDKYINLKISSSSKDDLYLYVLEEIYYDEIINNLENKISSTLPTGTKGYYSLTIYHEGQPLTKYRDPTNQQRNLILSISYKLIPFSEYVSYFSVLPDDINIKILSLLNNKTLNVIIDTLNRQIIPEGSLTWQTLVRYYNPKLYECMIEVIDTFYKQTLTESFWSQLYKYMNGDISRSYYCYNGDQTGLLNFIFYWKIDNDIIGGYSFIDIFIIAKIKLYNTYLNNFYDKFFGFIATYNPTPDDLNILITTLEDVLKDTYNTAYLLELINNYPRKEILNFPPAEYPDILVDNPFISYYMLHDPMVKFVDEETQEDTILLIRSNITFYIKLFTSLFSKFGKDSFKFITNYAFMEFKVSISSNVSSILSYFNGYFIGTVYPEIIIEMNKRGLI